MPLWRPAYWNTTFRVISDWLPDCDQSFGECWYCKFWQRDYWKFLKSHAPGMHTKSHWTASICWLNRPINMTSRPHNTSYTSALFDHCGKVTSRYICRICRNWSSSLQSLFAWKAMLYDTTGENTSKNSCLILKGKKTSHVFQSYVLIRPKINTV